MDEVSSALITRFPDFADRLSELSGWMYRIAFVKSNCSETQTVGCGRPLIASNVHVVFHYPRNCCPLFGDSDHKTIHRRPLLQTRQSSSPCLPTEESF